jgi:hypothetical protein
VFPPLLSRNVAPVTLVESIGSENVAVTVVPVATPVAPFAGFVVVTVGGVTSGGTAVVNCQTWFEASPFPARSSTPVVTVAVYTVPAARGEEGVNVAVKSVSVTVPATGVAPERDGTWTCSPWPDPSPR